MCLSQLRQLRLCLQVLIITRFCIGDAIFFQKLVEEERSISELNLAMFQQLSRHAKTRPSNKDLNSMNLLKIMGEQFNIQYHAITKPSNLEKSFTEVISEETLLNTMTAELKAERFTISGVNISLKLHTNTRKYFRTYLQYLSYCPLTYRWKDLGQSVWPQYFKVTSCAIKPCSYPHGMNCNPSGMEQVSMLYWTCHSRVKKSGTRKCGWTVFKIKVISKCSCSCEETNNKQNN